MRDLAPDFVTAVTSSEVTPALLAHLDFAGDPLRVWSGVAPLSWDSQTWLGIGAFGGVEPIEEFSEIRAGEVTLTLNHIPGEALSGIGDLGFKRRAATLYLALFAGDSRTLIGVETLLRGTMDTLSISRAASSTIRLSLTNELARLRDSWGLLYTDAHQQSLYPGDTGLRFAAALQDKTIGL